MTTYSKETALYDTGAIKNGIDEAATTATNYLTTISGTTGISVHNANDEKNFVNINSTDGVTIYRNIDGTATDVANFGETVTIGKKDNAHMVMAPSSLSSKKGNSTYFDVNIDGPYMASELFYKEIVWIGKGPSGTKTGTFDITGATYENKVLLRFYQQSAKTGNHPAILMYRNEITLGTAVEITVYEEEDGLSEKYIRYNYDGDNTLTVTYQGLSLNYYHWVEAYIRERTMAPIYSFGLNSSGDGGNSFGIGENTIHNGANSFVLGKYNIPDDEKYVVIVGNGATNAQSNALTIDWNGNVIGQAMAGIIQMYAGSVEQSVDSFGIVTTTGAPDGWLLCDGSEVLVSLYPELAEVLGNTWGTPSSSARVKLPDLRGRAPIGVNPQAITGISARALGGKVGAEAVTLTAAQSGVPAHSHKASATANRYFLISPDTESADSASALSGSGYYFPRSSVTGWQHNANTQNNTAANASSAHTNMQPSAVVNFIICTGKTR